MSDEQTGNKWAWVFPGQGSQYVGMAKVLHERSAAVRQLFAQADDALGFNLSDLCFNGPEGELQQTQNAQPAILVASIAALTALKDEGKLPQQAPTYVGGHSLGEYSALVAAGSLTFVDAVRLVRERGRLMANVGQVNGESSTMLAVIGLEREQLEAISADCGVDIANFNTPTQTVLSGLQSKIAAAGEAAKAAGAKRVIPLPVSAAFHSRLMVSMADDLALFMAEVPTQEASIPIIANVTATAITRAEEIRIELVKQTYSPVQWVRSVQYMAAAGVDNYIEVGPGKVLAGLIRATQPTANVLLSEQLLA